MTDEVKRGPGRPKKIRDNGSEVITEHIADSKASVSHPKPLEDGTEGDSIPLTVLLGDVLLRLDSLYDDVAYIQQAVSELQIKAAGTERMSRVAKELGLD